MTYTAIKRALDIVMSLAVMLLFLPFLIPIIIALKCTAEGEVFYLQDRIGYKNRRFNILKFATMLKNSPNMGTGSLTLRNDPRVTPIGKYLRKSKINELPQMINVLKGDMSFVGPRPQVEKDFLAYPLAVQEKIYDAKPGITGIGSILFRDEEKLLSETSMSARDFYENCIAPYKGELEIWYHKKANLVTDFKLLFITFWVVVFPSSDVAFKIFKDLPPVPGNLRPGFSKAFNIPVLFFERMGA